jgi:hypothetical protein
LDAYGISAIAGLSDQAEFDPKSREEANDYDSAAVDSHSCAASGPGF